jgi:hypothetical protein
MNITQSSLVIVGANTPDVKVFWNGQEVPGIVGITIDHDAAMRRVTLKFKEDPQLAEMQEAGITIRRVKA